jgi:hypothetical protein
MILESKLDKTKYKLADPSLYVTGDKNGLDLVFLGRIAFFAKQNNVKIHISDGFRTHADQEKLYAQYKQGLLKLAEIPGRSWHEYGIAIDTSTQPMRGLSSLDLQTYGLCKPIKSEGWHVQPLETLNQTDRTKFAPFDLIPLVKKRYGFSDSTIDFLKTHPYPYDLFKKLYEVK